MNNRRTLFYNSVVNAKHVLGLDVLGAVLLECSEAVADTGAGRDEQQAERASSKSGS
jgi:hypothetical protein